MVRELPVDTGELADVFRRYPDVLAVYLFGSWASGKANPTSDIDVALIPGGDGLRERKLEILGDLTRIGLDKVDLVILDGDDALLNYAAIAPNVVLYAREDFDRGTAYSEVVRKYLDIEPYLRRQRRIFKQLQSNAG
ncbi:MAG: nucleotidyltransferase domain-containing protein [Trueperaceae bacterium]